MKEVSVGNRVIGANQPCFIIAEAGVNHNGDVVLAKRLIDEAAKAGVDAVKFQTFKADQIATEATPKADYQLEATEPNETHLEMLRRLELSPDAYGELQARCEERGLLFLSTPYDEAGVDLLEGLGVPAFKIGSGEITNWPFLEYVASKAMPIILATGMAYLSEVEEAVQVIRKAGNEELVLLHCVSAYPAKPDDANLRAMTTLATHFGVPVGFSDHTLGTEVARAAVALGATVIEKHFTLDRTLPGPDHQASLEPTELGELVRAIRSVELALGDGIKAPTPSEMEVREKVRRSLAAAEDLPTGVTLEASMLTTLRPGTGISPRHRLSIVGRRLKRPLKSGQLLSWEDLA